MQSDDDKDLDYVVSDGVYRYKYTYPDFNFYQDPEAYVYDEKEEEPLEHPDIAMFRTRQYPFSFEQTVLDRKYTKEEI
jgi:hypothetical protein